MPIHAISVLHAIQEQFNRFSFILVHDLEDSSASSLSPRKLVKVKKMERKDFLPFTNAMQVSQFKTVLGQEKKLLESGFAIFSRNSSAKVLVMHQNKEKKINGMTMHFSSRATA